METQERPHDVSVRTLYRAMEAERRPFLDRARDCARLTIPAVLPVEGSSSLEDRDAPFATVGARGVNSLASSMMMSAFPPNQPFFRVMPTAEANVVLDSMPDARLEVEEQLALYERTVYTELERRGYRAPASTVMRHLLVTGNVLVHAPDRRPMRLFRLDAFTRRNYPNGQVRDVVVAEKVPRDMVPEHIAERSAPDDTQLEMWEMHTHIHWPMEGDQVTLKQEIGGEIVDEKSWDRDSCPYIPLAWSIEPGEHYGRSFCEDYLGDFETLDAMMEALVHGAAAAAQVRVLVDPTGVTDLAVMETPNLSVRSGRSADITYAQMQKFADFSVTERVVAATQERLAQVFLMPEGSIRNAERVTATEIRMIQDHTDRATAGNTTVSLSFQLPLIRLVVKQLERRKALPALPKEVTDPVIVTGSEALSRMMDGMRVDAFLGDAFQLLGPEMVLRYLKPDSIFKAKAAAYQLDRMDFVRTEEEISQMEAQQMQRQIAASGLTAGADAAGAAAGAQLAVPPVQQE